MKFRFIFLLITIPFYIFAQNKIVGYQYAFNNGENVTYVPVSPVADFHLQTDIDVSTLTQLVNTIHIRFKDENGKWSSITSHMFIKPINGSQIVDRKITAYEYYFNNDTNNRHFTAINPQDDFHLITDVDVSQLPELVNTIHLRFKDDAGQWSGIVTKMFLKQISSSQTVDRKITGYEYYFNNDTNNRHFTAVNPQDDFHLITDVDVSQLPELVNTIHLRFKDDTGQWSGIVTKMFLKQISSNQTVDRKITGYEYYFNNDTNNRHFTAINPQDDFHLITDVDVSQLPNSLNILHIRFKDDTGQWSSMANQYFMRPPASDTLQGNNLVQYEYWFDNDRSNLKTIAIQPAQADVNVVELDVHHIWNGQHVLHTRYKDAYNKYSAITTDTITKTIYPYASFSADQTAICEGASVQFTNNSVDYDTVLWDFGDGNTSIDINPSHTYSQQGTYTVILQITENTTSQSIQIQQDISVYEYPVNTISVSSNFPACYGSTVTLTADAQNADYLWSTGETTQSIQVSTAGTYNVQVRNPQHLDCSVTSADIQVSFLPQFDNTISISGNNPACYGDTVTLTANEQNNVSYLWSTGETTQSIDVTQAGNYSVTLTSTLNNNCSIASNDVQVDFYPQIDNTISYDSNTEILHANQDSAIYQWLDCNNNYAVIQGETQQDFSPSVSGNYAVDITMNSCTERSDCMNITLSGIADNLLNHQVKIYPNPVSDKLIIENKIPVSIEISDLNGRRVCIFKSDEPQNFTVDMSHFTKGVYILKLRGLSGIYKDKISMYKLIKK